MYKYFTNKIKHEIINNLTAFSKLSFQRRLESSIQFLSLDGRGQVRVKSLDADAGQHDNVGIGNHTPATLNKTCVLEAVRSPLISDN